MITFGTLLDFLLLSFHLPVQVPFWFFFTIYFSINAFLYNIYTFNEQTIPITNTAKKQHDIVLIRRRCCFTVYFTYFKPREKRKKCFSPFFLSLHYTHKMFFFFFFSSFQDSLVYRRKKTQYG